MTIKVLKAFTQYLSFPNQGQAQMVASEIARAREQLEKANDELEIIEREFKAIVQRGRAHLRGEFPERIGYWSYNERPNRAPSPESALGADPEDRDDKHWIG